MGQQQLLLLVLGIVIVGLAIVAGINAVEQNQRKSSQDALVQEGFRFATDAKAWYLKPTQFGGAGSNAASLNGLTWSDLGVITNSGALYDTPWGQIALKAGSPASGQVEFEVTLNDNIAAGTSYGDVLYNPAATPEIDFAEGDD